MKIKNNKIYIQISLFLIIFFIIKTISAQTGFSSGDSNATFADKCKEKGERGERGRARSFSDCNTLRSDDEICCFITGDNNGEKYEGCIAMDLELFSNKSLTYEIKSFSGTLICDANYNSGNNFKNTYMFIYIFFLFLLF